METLSNDIPWLAAEWPAPSNIRAGVTLRGEKGQGCSEGAYSFFNLASHVGDNIDSVLKNRSLIEAPEPTWLEQVHSNVAIELPANEVNPVADASFTTIKGKTCVVLTADCLPLLISDKQGSCVAAVHAGWKGLNDGIIEATINSLPVHVGELLVWMGPAIGPDVYEVGEDVYNAFVEKDLDAKELFTTSKAREQQKRWMLNMYAAAKLRLKKLGVRHIYGGDYCTFSEKEKFYSYRRDGVTGRMASMIWIENN